MSYTGYETLSAEGRHVYLKAVETIHSMDEDTSEVTLMDALLLAYHAESYAETMRRAGLKSYTALDYYREKVKILPHADEYPADGLFQRAVMNEKKLVAYHNIPPDQLEAAMDLGGFPAPSIAIMAEGMPYSKYGTVTLIGNRNLVQPSRNTTVYSRDAYTATFPQTEYKKPKAKDREAFLKTFRESFVAVGEEYKIFDFRDAKNNDDATRFLTKLPDSSGMQFYYMKEVLKLDFPIPQKQPKDAFTCDILSCQEADIRDAAIRAIHEIKNDEMLLAQIRELRVSYWERVAARAKKRGDEDFKIYLDIADEASKMTEYDLPKYRYEVQRADVYAKEHIIDSDAVCNMLRSKEYSHIFESSAYRKWIQKEIAKVAGEPTFRLGRSLVPFTLDNVTKYLIKNSGSAVQNTLVWGSGNLAAAEAKKFRSIQEMHDASDKLCSSEEFDVAHEKVEKMGESYRMLVTQNQEKTLMWDIFSESMKGLAVASSYGDEDFQKGLRGFFQRNPLIDADKIPEEAYPLGQAYFKAISEMETEYFEAKPRRPVLLSEFTGAVVPDDIDPNIIHRLKMEGLHVETYDKNDDTARLAATERILSAHEEALFQKDLEGSPKGSVSFSATGKRIISLFEGADASTMVHEMAHVFLRDLEDLARFDPISRADLETIRDWASWKDGAAAEYKGTPWEQEFARREQQIVSAMKDGDKAREMQLRMEWQQERFARGFERYIESGKAPHHGLRHVFHKLGKMIRTIYHEFCHDGGTPSMEVKQAMGRMVAFHDGSIVRGEILDKTMEGMSRNQISHAIRDRLPELSETDLGRAIREVQSTNGIAKEHRQHTR